MLTPMLMILLLVFPYMVDRFLLHREPGRDRSPAAAAGLALLFLFTASGHFIQTGPMVLMLPSWIPERETLVYATGVLEIAIALAVYFARSRVAGSWAAFITLIAFFPANVFAALHHVPMGGHAWGPVYLLVRAPVQIFVLWWIWAVVLPNRSTVLDRAFTASSANPSRSKDGTHSV
ncbi:MAG TPA: hypothetical protein VE934_09375 [Polaromonas sp.]|nr:hypothetical protein [Polaromonas sp.]